MESVGSPSAWSRLCHRLRIGIAGALSSGSKALLLQESEKPRQISEHIYEVCNEGLEQCSAETVFFHGLELENSTEPHISTWLSRNKEELWLNWLQRKFPNVRILTVRYDASLVKTDEKGRFDSYLTCENLLGELTGRSVSVGEANCPIILVGHCLGGLVLKELLVMAATKLALEEDSGRMNGFLSNVKGIFCYASPHHGSELPDISIPYPRGNLFKVFTPLNPEAARRNSEFQKLRTKYKWQSVGVGENRPVTLSHFTGFIVLEASSRQDVDDYYTVDADHFNVCRPESEYSSNFTLLRDLIHAISGKAERSMPILSELSKNTVGLERKILAMQLKLETETRIAIVGMGGMGKTTLARAVYEKIAQNFQYSCFTSAHPSDKETSQDLRERIVNELVEWRAPKVSKWSELKGKKVLIVLDDAKFEAQVKVMTEEDNLSLQSRVIITARGRGFIERADLGFHVHELERLDDIVSRELFCLRAFGGNGPPSHLSGYTESIVIKCGGLPLALTVLGSYLSKNVHREREGVWNDALKRLRDAKSLTGEPEDGLWSVLLPSVMSLEHDEKEMFLDAATCFHGERLEEVQKVWTSCGLNSSIAWKNLLDLHLVREQKTTRVSFNGSWAYTRINVHDVLRGLGGKVAGKTRILAQDLHGVAELSDEEAKSVKVAKGWIGHFRNKLKTLRELKILWVDDYWTYQGTEGVNDTDHRTFRGSLFTKLEFLRAHNVTNSILLEAILESKSLKCLIFSTHGKKVSSILWAKFRNLQQLQYLEMQLSNGEQVLPHICHLEKLQHLEVSITDLEAIPDDIRKLRRLQSLTIDRCHRLKAISKGIGMLVDLEALNMLKCRKLTEISEDISKLGKLKSLKIADCYSLKALPKGIGMLRKLQVLSISGCWKVRAIPDGISKLERLKSLTIHDCKGLETIPGGIGGLKVLEALEISKCVRVTEISEEISELQGLQSLIISECSNLKSIPKGICGLRKLEVLKISFCASVHEIPEEVSELQRLQSLTISRCSNLESIPKGICELRKLQVLNICGCAKVETLPEEIGQLQGLEFLTIEGLSLTAIPLGISKLWKLQSLNFLAVWRLGEIPKDFGRLVNLQALEISDCHKTRVSPEAIGQLRSLTTLQLPIRDTLEITPARICQLHSPLKLSQFLDRSKCENLMKILLETSQLRKLESLNVHHRVKLLAMGKSEGELESCHTLDISWDRDLDEIPAELDQLRIRIPNLSISYCLDLEDVTVSHFDLVRMLLTRADRYVCQGPKKLSIESCGDFAMIVAGKPPVSLPIPGCHSLLAFRAKMNRYPESLSISECSRLERIPSAIATMSCVRTLNIDRCNKLKEISSNLSRGGPWSAKLSVNISGCPKLVIPKSTLDKFDLQGVKLKWTRIGLKRKLSGLEVDVTDLESDEMVPR